MNNTIFDIISSLLTAAIGSGAGWFFARRKYNADAKKSELDTVEQAVTIWRNLAQDMEAKAEVYRADINSLRADIEGYRKEIESLRLEIEKLHADNEKLLIELKQFKRKQQQYENANSSNGNAAANDSVY